MKSYSHYSRYCPDTKSDEVLIIYYWDDEYERDFHYYLPPELCHLTDYEKEKIRTSVEQIARFFFRKGREEVIQNAKRDYKRNQINP